MPTSDELVDSIRNQFPLVFGDEDLVSTKDFYAAYNAVADYTVRMSAPALGSETHKQQWSLAGASIFLIAMVLFKVGELKIGEAKVVIDGKVLIGYGVFLGIFLISFILRAGLDLKRASLARNKDSQCLSQLTNDVQAAFVRKNIQLFFWLEIMDEVRVRYQAYDEALSIQPGIRSAPIGRMRLLDIDISSLKKLDEFADDIASHEEFIKSKIREIEADKNRFLDKVSEYDAPVFSVKHPDAGEYGRFSAVEGFFNAYLKPWFDAIHSLSDIMDGAVRGGHAKRESSMLDAQFALISKAKNISRLYTFAEVVLPTLLAVSALVYVCWTLHVG